MDHLNSVREVASVFRDPKNRIPVFLIGAGASKTSGVPLAADLAVALVRRHLDLGLGRVPPDWKNWLDYSYVSSHNAEIARLYPTVVGRLLKHDALRSHVLLDLLWPTDGISSGYRRLADLVERRLIRIILTTNFDECLRIALFERYDKLRRFAEINRRPGDIVELDIETSAQIIWLHGRPEQLSDRNLKREIERPLNDELIKRLHGILAGAPLIVLGYRGSEPSIMDHFLMSGSVEDRYKYGLYWCRRNGDILDDKVGQLKRLVNSGGKRRLQELNIDGFDEFMADLVWEVFDASREDGPRSFLGQSFTLVDGLTQAKLKAMWWDRALWQMVEADQRGFSLKRLRNGFQFTNENKDYNLAKLIISEQLDGDFEIKLDIEGIYLDIQLQDASGADRNIYIDPPSRSAVLGRNVGDRVTIAIKRSGTRIGFATVVDRHIKMFDSHNYMANGKMSCFLSVEVPTGGHVALSAVEIKKI